MFFSPDQFFAHAVGDYVLQSDWMANEKTKKSVAALAHVVTYTLPFLFLTQNWRALLIIAGSHFVIDRWRLARYVCWLKNFLQPKTIQHRPENIFCKGCGRQSVFQTSMAPGSAIEVREGCEICNYTHHEVLPRKLLRNHPWSECSGTGYHQDRPAWLAVWLMIITDNLMHVGINALALRYFP